MAEQKQRAFTVTDAAKRQLRAVAEQHGLDPGKYLRLAIPPVWTGEGDFGIVIDYRGSGDVTIAHEGKPVLLVERDVARQLVTAVLDYKEPPEGPRFTLDVY